MIGTVHKESPLTLSTRIGSASGEKHTYTMLVGEPLQTPIIIRDDGKTFTLTWPEIIDLARSAFAIDDAAD
ncbi:hypothetical protein vBPaeMUSP1_84 [Pseudomonas phage vB_PaeM_USP_1]|uniref:Uncharacterized protein n=2 Tax=Pbunavirus TaxID=1198980 RepID=A0A7D5U6P5_9CAUD|nr:hypothetical protein H6S70_gp84 [Pseudomonas phage vB_PaeM_USP_1]QIQ64049.1 hypothetical protein Epa22_00040 [Pseudomonas phage Epa22]QOI69243.1 hypothetical protein [Pseudomonas phage PASA16]QSM01377.1 hypothetical protein vBPaeMV523_gp91 [Pseudomonas phage vB_PaeM_V523]WAW44755.1 hypothetical protein PB10_14c [Pseudomonas phage PB10]WFG37029.1 hypothetical protein 7712_00016 [Pseudomonas phage bmx-p2]WKV29354.1 hypothetical protein vBPaeMP1420_92 [Pseudomonas phage vB_PaeM_P1420]WNV4864